MNKRQGFKRNDSIMLVELNQGKFQTQLHQKFRDFIIFLLFALISLCNFEMERLIC